MSDLPDIINAVRAGDADVYRQLVQRLRPTAVAYAYSLLGDAHLAEDAVQDALVEAYQCLHELKEPAAFAGWFRRIVQRRCARMTRRKRVPLTTLEAAAAVHGDAPAPLDGVIGKETARWLKVAVGSLPDVQRQVTLLFYLGDRSVASISEFLGVPVGTVKHQLHVARQTLKERMTHMRRPVVTSLAPQFLVDDLQRTIAYYRDRLGFEFGEPWGGFYAIGLKDGLELHFKCAPKNASERAHRRDNEHLDASAGVEGIDAFYKQCVDAGVKVIKPLAPTPWGTKDFYVEDPDGYIICFGGH
jgi:RNA polymerase sigma factor (sigma-70 family)